MHYLLVCVQLSCNTNGWETVKVSNAKKIRLNRLGLVRVRVRVRIRVRIWNRIRVRYTNAAHYGCRK